jgi:hypothetical protein
VIEASSTVPLRRCGALVTVLPSQEP